MNKRKWILIFGCVAIVALFGVGIALAQDSRAGQPSVTQEGLVLPNADEMVTPVTMDDLLARVAEISPAFGGMFRDSENPDIMNVYLTDTSKAAETEAAIKSVFTDFADDRTGRGGIRILQANYSILDLKRWYDAAIPKLVQIPEVVSLDLDEGANRITIGVLDLDASFKIHELLSSLGVPQEAVGIEEEIPIVLYRDVDSSPNRRWPLYH